MPTWALSINLPKNMQVSFILSCILHCYHYFSILQTYFLLASMKHWNDRTMRDSIFFIILLLNNIIHYLLYSPVDLITSCLCVCIEESWNCSKMAAAKFCLWERISQQSTNRWERSTWPIGCLPPVTPLFHPSNACTPACFAFIRPFCLLPLISTVPPVSCFWPTGCTLRPASYSHFTAAQHWFLHDGGIIG